MTAPAPAAPAPASRRGQLALSLQEAITATVRLRSNRQMAADAGAFRAHMRQLLAAAEQDARRAGYSGDDVRFALFAAVAFLDESVLNSSQAMFAGWASRPLQDELFGAHTAGEMFFQYLAHLLARPDSEDLADVLEVYQQCMLLGFRGRYSATNAGELHAVMAQTAEKIARIRGAPGELSPSWAPPAEAIRTDVRDPWVRRLGFGAAGAALLTLLLYIAFRMSLASGAAELRQLGL